MVLDVIHRWKYSRAYWFEPFLTNLLLREAVPALRAEGRDLIVPMPLHRDKEAEREFNQAERLAGALGKATGLPVGRDLVRRVRATATQTKLSRRERAENMRGAFKAGAGEKLARRRRIVLVDDVLTTGATASACARILKRAGAADVCVWTVARGLLH
jgi:ComF family protein